MFITKLFRNVMMTQLKI